VFLVFPLGLADRVSEFARRRIQKYYQKDALVVHPPVNLAKFPSNPVAGGGYWLMVGRLVAYKNFDIAVAAFNRLGWPLKIVGTGVQEQELRQMAKGNVQFMGQVDDATLSELYRGAFGIVFPQEEDFGIVPLEAMASGRPVVALRSGGAMETVIDRITGLFFEEETPEALMDAVERASRMKWLPDVCRGQAQRFDIPVFKEKMARILCQ